jgi:hypothetical protein
MKQQGDALTKNFIRMGVEAGVAAAQKMIAAGEANPPRLDIIAKHRDGALKAAVLFRLNGSSDFDNTHFLSAFDQSLHAQLAKPNAVIRLTVL